MENAAGIVRSFPRSFLSITGADRVPFLHNVLTHDIKGLPIGQGRLACLLDRQGKIRAGLLVHAQAQAHVLELDHSQKQAALEGLRQYLISEEAHIGDLSDKIRVVPLLGPGSTEILQQAFPSLSLPTANLHNTAGLPELGIRSVVRWDLGTLPGYHLWATPETEQQLREKLASHGAKQISEEAFHALRIESGMPWPGTEMNETVILNELWNFEEMTSFTKGCYIGQEIVARIKYRAHPPRQLCGFLLDGDRLPPPKSAILLSEKPVGVVTSACFSPTLKRTIAMGFLTFGLPEKIFLIQTPAGSISAEVTSLPFV